MIQRFRASPAVRFLYWVFICATFAVCIDLLRRHLSLYWPRDWSAAHELDGLADWKSARLFELGNSPYTPVGLKQLGQDNVGHPPTTTFWYLPFSLLSKATVAEFSDIILWFLLIPHIYISVKELRWPAPIATTALVVSLILSSVWCLSHFDAIQFSEPNAFLYVLGWLFLRRNQDFRSGLCIGLATTMKLFPGVLIVFLVLARRWRAVYAAVASFGIVAAITTYRFGIQSWFLFLDYRKPIADQWLGDLLNSSLSGLITQISVPACVGRGYPSMKVSILSSSISVLLVVAATWLSWHHFRRARTENSREIDLPYALFALLSVFVNPFVWDHYYVLAIHPLFVIATQYWHLFWNAYRKWADRAFPTSNLIGIAVTSVFATGCMAFVVHALGREIRSTWWYIDVWNLSSLPLYHWRIHYQQALNFVPWILPIALCYIALALTRKSQLSIP